MIRPRWIAALALVTLCSVKPTLAEDWVDCNGDDISACTRIINSGGTYIDPSTIPRVLRSRDHGPWIEALQSFLASQGYDVGTIDGVYGAATQRALLAFQKSQGSRVSIKDILVRAWQERDIAYAYSRRGWVYRNKGEYDRAIADFDQAIRLKPDYAWAYFNRGFAYGHKGEFDRAIADFDEALRLKPDDADAYTNRGNSYLGKYNYDRAIADFDQALRLKPDSAEAYNNRGEAYRYKHDPDRAVADFDQAIRLKPDFAAAYYNRGLAYDRKGDLAKALVDFRVAVNLIPSDDPLTVSTLQRIAEIETKLASTPAATPALSKPAGSPGTFTAGGIVVEVSPAQVDGERITRISIEGELKPGDEKVFRSALLTVDDDDLPIVFLNSPGGDLNAGIEIGNTIWTNEFVTVVLDDAICASACALAWLGGRPRYVELGSAIGFHAPTRVDDPERNPDSVGSAVTGGYLNQLGFKTGAIAYMTELGPDEMRWLTPEDAMRLGIYYEVWDYAFEALGSVNSYRDSSSRLKLKSR